MYELFLLLVYIMIRPNKCNVRHLTGTYTSSTHGAIVRSQYRTAARPAGRRPPVIYLPASATCEQLVYCWLVTYNLFLTDLDL